MRHMFHHASSLRGRSFFYYHASEGSGETEKMHCASMSMKSLKVRVTLIELIIS